ncbi:MAG: class I SAM-dependent methyltransferase [Bacillota bacterium]|nr:class I SAM-dependent methyltransferase [Bacillota bacterium]
MSQNYPEDNHFRYATISFGLRNVSNYMETLKESWRVLWQTWVWQTWGRFSRPVILTIYDSGIIPVINSSQPNGTSPANFAQLIIKQNNARTPRLNNKIPNLSFQITSRLSISYF